MVSMISGHVDFYTDHYIRALMETVQNVFEVENVACEMSTMLCMLQWFEKAMVKTCFVSQTSLL